MLTERAVESLGFGLIDNGERFAADGCQRGKTLIDAFFCCRKERIVIVRINVIDYSQCLLGIAHTKDAIALSREVPRVSAIAGKVLG